MRKTNNFVLQTVFKVKDLEEQNESTILTIRTIVFNNIYLN